MRFQRMVGATCILHVVPRWLGSAMPPTSTPSRTGSSTGQGAQVVALENVHMLEDSHVNATGLIKVQEIPHQLVKIRIAKRIRGELILEVIPQDLLRKRDRINGHYYLRSVASMPV
jgi:hypothetical protein